MAMPIWPATPVKGFEGLTIKDQPIAVPINKDEPEPLYLNIGAVKHARTQFAWSAATNLYAVPRDILLRIAKVFTLYNILFGDAKTPLSQRVISWFADLGRILISPLSWAIVTIAELYAAVHPSAYARSAVVKLENALFENDTLDYLKPMTRAEVDAWAHAHQITNPTPRSEISKEDQAEASASESTTEFSMSSSESMSVSTTLIILPTEQMPPLITEEQPLIKTPEALVEASPAITPAQEDTPQSKFPKLEPGIFRKGNGKGTEVSFWAGDSIELSQLYSAGFAATFHTTESQEEIWDLIYRICRACKYHAPWVKEYATSMPRFWNNLVRLHDALPGQTKSKSVKIYWNDQVEKILFPYLFETEKMNINDLVFMISSGEQQKAAFQAPNMDFNRQLQFVGISRTLQKAGIKATKPSLVAPKEETNPLMLRAYAVTHSERLLEQNAL